LCKDELFLDALGSCEDYHIFKRPKDTTRMLVALTPERLLQVKTGGLDRRWLYFPVYARQPKSRQMLELVGAGRNRAHAPSSETVHSLL
jgi:hypothetical protein